MLFLSYADEDSVVAEEVAAWLQDRGHQVCLSRANGAGPAVGRGQEVRLQGDGSATPQNIADQISQATNYIALYSPDFLRSASCGRERLLAEWREQQLRRREPGTRFFHVLQVRETGGYGRQRSTHGQWPSLVATRNLDNVLPGLERNFRSAEQSRGPAHQASGALVYFRNRSDEVEQCLRGLTNTSGPHFWLVVAPPQLGKTWFLHEIGSTLDLGKPVPYLASPARPWSVQLVDIGEVPARDRNDVGQLLRRIFDGDATGATDDDALRLIAQQIVSTGERCLRLIDSADLLAVETSRSLRRCLSQIHDIVIEADPEARLAVVVASRRDTEWRGLVDGHPTSVLKLTEFTDGVVLQALGDLAEAMRPHGFPDGVLKQNADRVHNLSEGLPALLVRCLEWIQVNNWVRLDRLQSREVFTELAEPYIRKDLLAPESLFPLTHGRPEPETSGPAGVALEALEHAIRNLVRYRLFTQSHLRRHLDDPDLARCMAELGWGVEDLWREISGTALLTRPLNEPWQEFPSAIRRLLFRFWYADEESEAHAHRAARSFMTAWAETQSGKEQIVGLVESLWHEAAIPRSLRSSGFDTEICELARRLSRGLRPSLVYSVDEIRRYAGMRIAEDAELRQAVGNDVLNQLVSVIVVPGTT